MRDLLIFVAVSLVWMPLVVGAFIIAPWLVYLIGAAGCGWLGWWMFTWSDRG